MDLSWVIFAFGLSVFLVFEFLIKEYFPGRMLRLLFLMRLFSFIALLPVLVLIEPPTEILFYVGAIVAAILFGYSDLIVGGLMQKNGAGVVARVQPLSSWVLFFGWTALSPALLVDYIENPIRLLGIIAALTACVYFALRLKQCDVTWETMKRIAPSVMLVVVATIFSKMAMVHSGFHSGVYYYALIQASFLMLFYLALFRFKSIPGLGDLDLAEEVPEKLFTKRAVLFGLMAMVALLFAQISKYYAISLAENPAYVTMFGLLTPFWILIVYRAIGRRESADIWSGLGIVASAAALVFFTQL